VSEVSEKIKKIRQILNTDGIEAVRFRGVDWFSWATGGGSSVVIFTNEIGVAEVLITQEKALVLTSPIEARRLKEEELTNDYEVITSPWFDVEGTEKIVRGIVGDSPIFCDRPVGQEIPLSHEFQTLKMSLTESEVTRYKKLGAESAAAMSEAIKKSSPQWTENQLAAAGAAALWERGIHPTLILVAGANRVEKHRHPFPTNERLGHRAMMVFCARRHGLYANLTRWVSFKEPTAEETARMKTVAEIEATAINESRAGKTMGDMFQIISAAYKAQGIEDQVAAHHFGGLTGYLSREAVSTPGQRTVIPENSALAWNPSMPGAKIEDTILTSKKGIEILTVDPTWPTTMVHGRARPEVWIKP
jgi:Xaa-Pro aminopeptidase